MWQPFFASIYRTVRRSRQSPAENQGSISRDGTGPIRSGEFCVFTDVTRCDRTSHLANLPGSSPRLRLTTVAPPTHHDVENQRPIAADSVYPHPVSGGAGFCANVGVSFEIRSRHARDHNTRRCGLSVRGSGMSLASHGIEASARTRRSGALVETGLPHACCLRRPIGALRWRHDAIANTITTKVPPPKTTLSQPPTVRCWVI